MAKLELHFPTGLIGHAGLSPERPLLLGAHPRCDVVLTDEDVGPVHCRIYWKRDGFRVEAAPNVDGVELNGRLVRTAPLVSGDTLRLGATRVVLITEGELLAPAQQGHVPDRADQTEPYSDVWAALDRGELDEVGPPLPQRTTGARWWQLGKGAASKQDHEKTAPPGQERLLRSPLILGLAGVLVVLTVTGLILWIVSLRLGGEHRYDDALEAMEEGLYAEAVRRFDRFLEDYPDHKLVDNAKVLRALCQVRRFSDGSAPSPTQAVRQAREMVNEVGRLPAFGDVQTQLAEILGRVAQQLAEQARRSADKQAFDAATDALQLLESMAQPQPGQQEQFQNTLNAARAAIGKADRLEQALQAMQNGLDDKDPLAVYRQCEQLVRQFPDLASEPRLLEQLRQATALERAAISWQPGRPIPDSEPLQQATSRSARPAVGPSTILQPAPFSEPDGQADVRFRYTSAAFPQATSALTSEPPSPILTSTTFVVRTSDAIPRGQPGSDEASRPVVFAMVGGALYAVDAASGDLLWRRVVGHDISFLPQLIPAADGTGALVSDARRNELLLVDARTGSLLWRQSLGQAFDSAPLVLQGRIFLATRAGHLLVLDAQTGRVQGHVRFPQRLSHTPVIDGTEKYIYIAAEFASLYVLSAASLECDRVLYLGHARNSIRTEPLSVGEFLIVAENHTLRAGRLHVLDTSSAATGPVQQLTINGWVAGAPVGSGRHVWVATDAGSLYAFQVSPARPSSPLTLLAQSDQPDEAAWGSFLLPWSEQECFSAADELRRYQVSDQQQRLDVDWSNGRLGAPTQPLQRRGNLLFSARQTAGTSDVLLTALDARNHSPLWQLRLGARPAAVLLDPRNAGPKFAASPSIVLTQSGHAYRLSDQPAGAKRVLVEPFANVELTWSSLQQDLLRLLDNKPCVLGITDTARQLLVWTAVEGRLEPLPHWIELPVEAAAPPALFRDELLIPASDQRLYLLAADTGRQIAVPFQPPITARQTVQWSNPVVVQPDVAVAADTRGTLFRVELAHDPLNYLTASHSRSLDRSIVSPLVALDGRVYFVDDANTLHAVSAADLSPVGTWALPAGAPIGGPWAMSDYLLVESGGKEMLCLDRDTHLLWRESFDQVQRIGPPLLHENAFCFVQPHGTLWAVRARDGKELWRLDVHEPLTAGFVTLAGELAVVSDDGTLHTLDAPAMSP